MAGFQQLNAFLHRNQGQAAGLKALRQQTLGLQQIQLGQQILGGARAGSSAVSRSRR